MTRLSPIVLTLCAASPVLADSTRQLDAHEHGVGNLLMAFENGEIALRLEAPGADIVGFEYTATSAEDRKAVEAAIAQLARPLDLFELPEAAGCSVARASASLLGGDDHDGDDDHDDHAGHSDHDHHDNHASHDAHDHDDHAEHASEGHHGDHAHAEADGHTEFHAEYVLTCADPGAVTRIAFPYFETFENALKLEIQTISDAGAQKFEVGREAPVLDLRGIF